MDTMSVGTTQSGAPTPRSAPCLRLIEGDCWAFFAFDVGHSIDLDLAQRVLAGGASPVEPLPARLDGEPVAAESARREEIPRGRPGGRRRAPDSFQFRPAPLRLDQHATDLCEIVLGGFRPSTSVECTFFGFGAISVAYRFPIVGGEAGIAVEGLLPLAQALFDCAPLREHAQRRVAALSARLASAIDRPSIASIVEDYTVYHARRWQANDGAPSIDASAAILADGEAVSRLLLGEAPSEGVALSPRFVESTLSSLISYSASDAAVIDWNAALVLGPDEEASLAVLEFANVELLEVRFLDDRLDDALDRSYASILRRDGSSSPRSPLGLLVDPSRVLRQSLAAFQMENAILFEGVNNALKLIGDQHLARLYAAAVKRFHMQEWDASILRKLHTIDGLYQKLAGEQSGRRMEVLEWIVIILFAVSIVLPFLTGLGK
jgi:hypothetical protein